MSGGDEALFVATTPGLELALAEELRGLGLEARAVSGGAQVQGPAGAHARVNLYSRVASRVLLRVAEVGSVRELQGLRLRAFADAFEVDAFGQDAGVWGGALPSTHGGARLVLRGLPRGRCEVSVDTTGELLHFRGYRQEVGRAPMRETLAAGLLRLAKWEPGEALWDVMCGSGTILIEAAEQALGLAAGRNRRFTFETFPGHDAAAFAALPRKRAPVAGSLRGSDLNAGALGTARRNARRAGVVDALTLERLDARKLPPASTREGLVVANLPYGKRVGERDELGALYRALGASLQQACPGWYFAFLLQDGAERLGLPLAERHEVSNGGLPCEVVLGQVPAAQSTKKST